MAFVLGIAIFSSVGVINYVYLMLDFEKVFYKVQIWRLATCFMFAGGLSFKLLFTLFYIHFAMSHSEEYFAERKHDFYYLMLLAAVFHYIIGWAMDMH